MSKENGLLLAAVVVVALVVGGVYTLTGNNRAPAPSGSQVAQRPAAPVSAQQPTAAVADPLLCGNGVLDVGEQCDISDFETGYDIETGTLCDTDCTIPSYGDQMECMEARHAKNCVDANDDPVANYYDCVDAQNAYCQGFSY